MRYDSWRRLFSGALLCSSAYATQALADPGCKLENIAHYQIGQAAYIDVSSNDPVGERLRQGEAEGEGVLLLTCNEGPVTFHGRWQNHQAGDLLPLTIGGYPAGVGLKLVLREGADEGQGDEHVFPHAFARPMRQGQQVRSDMDSVRYEIYRTSEPLRFGKLDALEVAQSNVEQIGGGLAVFRTMKIHELSLRRQTCSILADDLKQVVKLPAYNLSNFANPGRTTPWEPFHLRVENCPDPLGLVAGFTFGTAADADDNRDWFSLTGPKNVAMELGTATYQTIAPGKIFEMNALGTGGAYQFYVRLRETRLTVEGGEFSRMIKVQVDYR